MSKKKFENNNLENVSGGISQAANGTFWLTDSEADKLKKAGYSVSYKKGLLPGWKGIECGGVFDNRVAYCVNDCAGQRIRDVEVLKQVLKDE